WPLHIAAPVAIRYSASAAATRGAAKDVPIPSGWPAAYPSVMTSPQFEYQARPASRRHPLTGLSEIDVIGRGPAEGVGLSMAFGSGVSSALTLTTFGHSAGAYGNSSRSPCGVPAASTHTAPLPAAATGTRFTPGLSWRNLRNSFQPASLDSRS